MGLGVRVRVMAASSFSFVSSTGSCVSAKG